MFGLTPYNRKSNGLRRRNDFFNAMGFFDEFFNDSQFPAVFASKNGIRADIKETEKEYVVEAEIPGVKKEDIKLELKNDVLTISAEQNEEINEEKDNYIRRERRYGSFARSFYVDNVKNEGVTAKYEDGVLKITLPKADTPKEENKRIEIE